MKNIIIKRLRVGLAFCVCLSILGLPLGVFAAVAPLGEEKSLIATNSYSAWTPAGEFLLAQTSEVTITLEKKIPPKAGEEGLQEKPLDQQGPSAPGTGPGSEKVVPYDETASSLKSTQKPETYEGLEDPFAEDIEDLPVLADPFEGYNRFMFDVNETIYDYFMEPVARGWRYVLHEDVRIAIKNLFDNALSPVKLVSSLFQGDLDKSGRVLSRVVINTTIGIGGLFDVAGNTFDIKNVNEDFDQALGYHRVPTGPYIVLPLLGPSTARNMTGRVVDSFLSPSVILAPSFLVGAGISVGENVNETSFIIEDKEQLEEGALDEYESVRDFYHQYREGLLRK